MAAEIIGTTPSGVGIQLLTSALKPSFVAPLASDLKMCIASFMIGPQREVRKLLSSILT
jgi:hypothetical protein